MTSPTGRSDEDDDEGRDTTGCCMVDVSRFSAQEDQFPTTGRGKNVDSIQTFVRPRDQLCCWRSLSFLPSFLSSNMIDTDARSLGRQALKYRLKVHSNASVRPSSPMSPFSSSDRDFQMELARLSWPAQTVACRYRLAENVGYTMAGQWTYQGLDGDQRTAYTKQYLDCNGVVSGWRCHI